MHTKSTFAKYVPIIGVMGSGKPGPFDSLAYELGKALAAAGYMVLTGGGGGIMSAVSRGAAEAGGTVIGILPSSGPDDPLYGGYYPNPYVTIPIYTGMSDARNVINVKSSDVVVALPGEAGTLSEVALALKNGKPVILLKWSELKLPFDCRQLVSYVEDVPGVLNMIKQILEKR